MSIVKGFLAAAGCLWLVALAAIGLYEFAPVFFALSILLASTAFLWWSVCTVLSWFA